MTQTADILDRMQRVHAGEPWHGAPVCDVLAGITAAQALARPIPPAHSIWEILLHMNAWQGEVLRRLQEGAKPELPAEGDWPEVADSSPAAWDKALAAHENIHAALVAALQHFDPTRLTQIVGGTRDPALGAGTAFATMLHGIVDHELYHSGQIGVLRKNPAPAGGFRGAP